MQITSTNLYELADSTLAQSLQYRSLANAVRQDEKSLVGSCPPVEDGWKRLIECDASKIVEMPEFETRYASWDGLNPRKYILYPLNDSEAGSCIYRNWFTPVWDASSKAFSFPSNLASGGNPSFVTLGESELYGYGNGNPNEKGPRNIRSGVCYRFDIELYFSDNLFPTLDYWLGLTRVPWWRLLQVKNTTASWRGQFVWALGWDRTGHNLRFLLQGDSRMTLPTTLETDINIGGLVVVPGKTHRFVLEQTLDATGTDSYTRVTWDDILIHEGNEVNCFPRTDGHDPHDIGQCRGIYFGSYTPSPPPQPVTVSYSNPCVDVRV